MSEQSSSGAAPQLDFSLIEQWIPDSSKVLDLACGDGQLLRYLSETKAVKGYGVENDPEQITRCIENGVNVIQRTISKHLELFSDQSFDCVIMTQALQIMQYPDVILEEMLRVGKRCIVTFPNFGVLQARAHLFLRGRMPVTKRLAYEWYDTPNIHFCTVRDFQALCAERDIQILDRKMVAEQTPNRALKDLWPNVFAETAIYHLARNS